MLQKVRFGRSDKVVFHGTVKSGLRVLFGQMAPSVSSASLALTIGVGGYGRTFTIDKVNIPSGTPGLLLEAIRAKHPEKSDVLFTSEDIVFSTRVEESYCVLKVDAPASKILDCVEPLLALTDELAFSSDDVENLKPAYLKKIREEEEKPANRVRPYLYISSPMKLNPYGNEKSLKAIHFSTLKKFFQEAYVPTDMTLCLVGNADVNAFEKAASSHFFKNNAPTGKVEVKPFKENYAQVVQTYVRSSKPGEFIYAVKLPLRKSLVESCGEDIFSYYEILSALLFSQDFKANAAIREDVLSLGEGGVKQGGEDAFFYQVVETGKKEELEDRISAFLSDPKSLKFFDFRSLTRAYMNKLVKEVYLKDSSKYCDRLVEALANDFIDEAVSEQVTHLKRRKLQNFLLSFASFPKVIVD